MPTTTLTPLLDLPAGVDAVAVAVPGSVLAGLTSAPAAGTSYAPVLLLPGYTGSKEDFLPVLRPLAHAGFAVTALDLRGQAGSPAAADPAGYDLAALAADVVAVARGLGPAGDGPSGAGGVHLLGHSFGGLVGRAAVLAAADAFRSLTLLCSGPGALVGSRADLVRLLAAVLPSYDLPSIWQLKRQLERDAGLPGRPPAVEAFHRRRFMANCPSGLLRMAEQLLDTPDRTDELAALARREGLPLHVVYGQYDDAWQPSEQADMARRLGARETVLPGLAHSPAVEGPAATAAVLAGFWADVDTGPASTGSPDDPTGSTGTAARGVGR